MTPSDDRRLVVDAFARWRISDVETFRQATGTGGVSRAKDRLQSILISEVRQVLGADQVTSNTILSADRAQLMTRIRDAARKRANPLGVTILDVRLKQTNLPKQNLDATFARMRAERQREAEDERARGREAAQRVRAQADRTVIEITSDAQRQADITRGEADAQRAKIFADAYSKDVEFFDFYRSLQAYRDALKAGNSTMVISPDSEFFDYFKNATPEAGQQRSAAAKASAASAGSGQDGSGQGAAQPAPSATDGSSAPSAQAPSEQAPAAANDNAAPATPAPAPVTKAPAPVTPAPVTRVPAASQP